MAESVRVRRARTPACRRARDSRDVSTPRCAAISIDAVVGGDQLFARRRVDAVVARAGDRRRADAHVHLARAGAAHERDETARRRAAHDRVVDHHDALAVEDLANRIVLHLHLRVAAGLRRLDERAAHVVIADQRELEGSPLSSANPSAAEFDESGTLNTRSASGAGCSRASRLPERAARAIDRAAEDAAVRAREVHVLEHAAPRFQLRQRMRRLHAVAVDRRRSRPARRRARTWRRRCRARTSPTRTRRRRRAGPSRAAASRADRARRATCRRSRRSGCTRPPRRLSASASRIAGVGGGGARELVDDHLGVHRRGEDRTLVLELVTHLGGVDQVAVVGERDVAALGAREDRLRIVDRRRAGGAVARVADGRRRPGSSRAPGTNVSDSVPIRRTARACPASSIDTMPTDS